MKRIAWGCLGALILGVFVLNLMIPTIADAKKKTSKAHMVKIADDLYFWSNYKGTNSAVWITDDGVMVM